MIDELFQDEYQVLDDPDIGSDQFFHARPQDLHNDFFPAIPRAMDLPQ